MHYLFDEVLERLKTVPGFEACSDPIPRCPKSADARCTSGYTTCQDGKTGSCVQYFDYFVNSRMFSVEIKFYDAPDTHRGLVLKKNVALAWLFSKNILDESAFTPVK